LRKAASAVMFVFLLLGFSASALVSVSVYVDVSVSQAKQMIDSNPDLVILDVRTQSEYDAGHIQNATLIPVSELGGRLGELDKNKEILVYCASGGRSATASQTLADNGFSKVYNMLGGITAWKSAGYWIEIIHKGDLIVNGTQTFAIENCTYIQTGNIYVLDQARLNVRNANLTLNQTYHDQYGIFIRQFGQLEMHNVEAISPKVFPISLQDLAEAEIETISTNGRLECAGNSSTQISDSLTYAALHIGDYAQVTLLNSTHLEPYIAFDFRRFTERSISISGLRSGFFEYWNTYENTSTQNIFNLTICNSYVGNWQCWFPSNVGRAEVVNCTLSCLALDFSEQEISVNNLKNGFYGFWNLGNIYVVNSSVTENWAFILWSVNATFSNCIVHLHLNGANKISVENSTVKTLILDSGNTTINFNETTLYGGLFFGNSNLYFSGGIVLEGVDFGRFVSSQVTRNYNLVATDTTGQTLENAELTLLDKNTKVIWNGITDSIGEANFNLTYTDSNYMDTLRLEASKGELSAAKDIAFLSDTPVTLVMNITVTADINNDGSVDIYDAILLANSFNSIPTSPNWNSKADLNSDNIVDIYDAIILANNYGKPTVSSQV